MFLLKFVEFGTSTGQW